MHTSIKAGLLTATTAIGLAVAAPATAQEIEGTGLSVSGNVAMTTDYRFRGVSLSDGNIAVQGGIDVEHESGFYAGSWASSLSQASGGYGAIELDVYGGWSGEVTSGLTLDAGFLAYIYPDANPGDFDYYEPYASLGYAFGPVDTTVGVAYAFKQDGIGDYTGDGKNDDNLYLYFDVSAGIPDTPVTLNGHVGYTDGGLAPDILTGSSTDDTAFDWSLGLDVAVTDNLTASFAYADTEGTSTPDFTDAGFFFTLAFSM